LLPSEWLDDPRDLNEADFFLLIGSLFMPGRDYLTSEFLGAIAKDCPVLLIKSSAVSGGYRDSSASS